MNFVLIGAGYVAPRHVKAIKETGNQLLAFTDPYDGVGWMDQYFPEARYFPEFERFDRYCHKQRGAIHYVSICSPNYLHDSHARWAMNLGANAIVEKPLVLTERNLDGLAYMEEKTNRRVYTILQLRLHPKIIDVALYDSLHIARVQYSTPRGKWYSYSWKSDVTKSGGLATNIGVHLFDLCAYFFGAYRDILINTNAPDTVSGWVVFKRADVEFALSINGNSTQRLFEIDHKKIELSSGFENLHTKSYQEILSGNGFGIEHARESIRICQKIREL